VRPPRPITAPVARIHRISNQAVAAAPPVGEVAAQIRAALDGRVVVGHHVGVDISVLSRELGGWRPTAVLDTLWLAKAVWPALRSYRLDALAEKAQLPSPPDAAGRRHRAGHDATLTAGLFLALTRAADPAGTLSAVRLLRLAGPVRPARTTPACSNRSAGVKIAVAGTHSTGKTTFLTRLRHLLETAGYHVTTVADQAAGARDLGFPILRNQTGTTTLWIMTSGIAAELVAARRADVVLVDRPITDALAYQLAAHACHHAPSYRLTYRTVIDPALGVKDDGHRDIDPHHRQLVDEAITTVHTRLDIPAVPLYSYDHTSAVRHALLLARRTVTPRGTARD